MSGRANIPTSAQGFSPSLPPRPQTGPALPARTLRLGSALLRRVGRSVVRSLLQVTTFSILTPAKRSSMSSNGKTLEPPGTFQETYLFPFQLVFCATFITAELETKFACSGSCCYSRRLPRKCDPFPETDRELRRRENKRRLRALMDAAGSFSGRERK